MISMDSSATGMTPFTPHWDLYPRTYVAHKTSYPLIDNLDGDLTKDVWSNVPWSEYFDDIRGPEDAPGNERPNEHCKTRFKALWDDTHLYIGAVLESDFETQAHFTQRNSPIFQKDSDFEVFLDPFGCCHNYKELELNAINTIWNLMLDRPYADGGEEHSGRLAKPGDERYYEVYSQKTATKVVRGKLNNPEEGATWSVEVALSYKDILAHTFDESAYPIFGSLWRINFSRVEKKGDINWTWQPQKAWNPKAKRFSGFVDMHRPDAWGYIFFGGAMDGSTKFSEAKFPRDSSWPGRLAAMNVYYAQKEFREQSSSYASTLEQLSDFLDPAIVDPFEITIVQSQSEGQSDGFTATISGNIDGSVVSITNDRLLIVDRPESVI